jgi:hypothetical protein
MYINTMEEGEISDVAGEVVMEDIDYAKVKNKVITLKKKVPGETGPELSYEERRAQFSTETEKKNLQTVA